MATSVTVTSDVVSNPSAASPTLNDVSQVGGRIRVVGNSFEVTAANITSAGQSLVLAQLPAQARIWHVWVFTDDLDTGVVALTWDFGVLTTANVDVNVDAYTPTPPGNDTLKGVWTDVTALTGATGALVGQTVWEAAGVSADPGAIEYKIIAQVQTAPATPAAGTFAYIIEYTID